MEQPDSNIVTKGSYLFTLS